MTTPSSTSIMCKDIKKTYSTGQTSLQVLHGINLEVLPGELLILAGPSGCGKTTLISIISGILSFEEGSCQVYGHFLEKMTDAEKNNFRRNYIGFVFQQFNLLPSLTVAENVAVPLIIKGWNREKAIEKSIALLEAVGLGNRSHSNTSQLSGGQQQRVAIARSIIHDPKLVVCDEPTSALDKENGQKVMTLLKNQVINSDRSMIVVTHDSRAYEFADRIAEVEDGRIVRILKKGDL